MVNLPIASSDGDMLDFVVCGARNATQGFPPLILLLACLGSLGSGSTRLTSAGDSLTVYHSAVSHIPGSPDGDRSRETENGNDLVFIEEQHLSLVLEPMRWRLLGAPYLGGCILRHGSQWLACNNRGNNFSGSSCLGF